MFVRLKNGEQFCEAQFVRLAGGAIPVLLDPFGMLLAKRVVNLMLKLNVRADFAGAARRRIHIHVRRYGRLAAPGRARPADFAVLLKRERSLPLSGWESARLIGTESSPSCPCPRALADGNGKATCRE